jgi:hypothetical protein
MADSIRQSIMSSLIGYLEDITTDDDAYNTDIGDNIYEWKITANSQSDLPCLIVKDRINRRTPGSIGKFRWEIAVDFEIYLSDSADDDLATNGRLILQDILKAIGLGNASRWGGYALETTLPGGDEMTIESHDMELGIIVLTALITYEAPQWEL